MKFKFFTKMLVVMIFMAQAKHALSQTHGITYGGQTVNVFSEKDAHNCVDPELKKGTPRPPQDSLVVWMIRDSIVRDYQKGLTKRKDLQRMTDNFNTYSRARCGFAQNLTLGQMITIIKESVIETVTVPANTILVDGWNECASPHIFGQYINDAATWTCLVYHAPNGQKAIIKKWEVCLNNVCDAGSWYAKTQSSPPPPAIHDTVPVPVHDTTYIPYENTKLEYVYEPTIIPFQNVDYGLQGEYVGISLEVYPRICSEFPCQGTYCSGGYAYYPKVYGQTVVNNITNVTNNYFNNVNNITYNRPRPQPRPANDSGPNPITPTHDKTGGAGGVGTHGGRQDVADNNKSASNVLDRNNGNRMNALGNNNDLLNKKVDISRANELNATEREVSKKTFQRTSYGFIETSYQPLNSANKAVPKEDIPLRNQKVNASDVSLNTASSQRFFKDQNGNYLEAVNSQQAQQYQKMVRATPSNNFSTSGNSIERNAGSNSLLGMRQSNNYSSSNNETRMLNGNNRSQFNSQNIQPRQSLRNQTGPPTPNRSVAPRRSSRKG